MNENDAKIPAQVNHYSPAEKYLQIPKQPYCIAISAASAWMMMKIENSQSSKHTCSSLEV